MTRVSLLRPFKAVQIVETAESMLKQEKSSSKK